MKTKIVTGGAVLLALIAILCVASCGAIEELPDHTPRLISLSITTIANDVATGVPEVSLPARIPQAVSFENYNNENFNLFGAGFVEIPFKREAHTHNVRIEAEVSGGAYAEWGIGNRGVRPDEFFATGVPASFNDGNYIYLKVVSREYADHIAYYRFQVHVLSIVKELAEMSMGDREIDPTWTADAVVGSQSEDWSAITNAGTGTISLTRGQGANAVVNAVPWEDNSTFRYAKVTNATAEPEFGDSNRFSFDDQNYLYIEVTAQNTLDKSYYKFRVDVGRVGTIKKLEFIGDNNRAYEAVGKGSPGSPWTSADIVSGTFETPHQPPTGFKLRVELDDPDAFWYYAVINSVTAAQPGAAAWLEPNPTSLVRIENNQALAIRVITYQGGNNFYKVRIVIRAAEFNRHPKSRVYMPGDTAEALDFELDRDLSGATYQWYEANSWYGGYGFDANGNITLRKKEAGDSAQTGEKEDGDWILEEDFTAQQDPLFNAGTGWQGHPGLYATNLDEKNNVSFFNGGNYFRYPVAGRIISGETGPTYTPPIDSNPSIRGVNRRHPFIGGWTSETHYYWVVVTAGGYTATSARAVIVTETDPQKRHHMVDVNNWSETSTDGIRASPKNIIPFSAKDENYRIPIRFPAGFNIMNYDTAVVQAKFYLKDGTPWIQNWTQGNFSFEDSGQNNIVKYYNLSNNNASYGLEGDGKEPQGGALRETPAYLVVSPSGEKPVKRMPPLTAAGIIMPDSMNPPRDAQGWFCGFIEIVEFRLESNSDPGLDEDGNPKPGGPRRPY